MIGTKLAHYEITSHLGSGGMGDVYQATDSKLGRSVAIKFLPAAFASDPERLLRFRREAQVLASLNHANIAHIYGLEEAGETRCIVMELVEGETLQARIRSGPSPIGEALAIAKQIAEALEAAHEKGIVHRDLKPGNVMLTRDGVVKVLDFGLAKASDDGGANPVLSNSPTMGSIAATNAGVILGTAAYMSPEQARGQIAGKQADIWAFGVVLFELVSGSQLFEGGTVSDTLAAVLRQDIDWARLPASTPPEFVALIRRCLERDPKRRLRDIGDARFDLFEAERGSTAIPAIAAGGPFARTSRWLLAGLAAVTIGSLALAAWSLLSGSPLSPPTQLSIALPEGHSLMSGPAISRDGRRVAFVSSDGVGRPQLYVRALDESDPRLLPDTDEADSPFFSPDGNWIAYYAKNKLFKVRVDGGAPVQLAPSMSHAGGAWTEDGAIIFKKTWNGGLDVVGENGGPSKPFLAPEGSNEYAYVWPYALPGGHDVLFASWGKSFETVLYDAKEKGKHIVVPQWWRRFAYAPGGLLIGADAGELRAAQMPASGGTSGKVVTVVKGVDLGSSSGDARFDVSQNGTLAYVRRQRGRRWLSIVDRSGHSTRVQAPEGEYGLDVRLSPDGRRAAVNVNGALSIIDLEKGTVTPLVSELNSGSQGRPVWSADGRSVTFASNHEGNWEIYSKPATGSGELMTILKQPLDQFPSSYASDGTLLFQTVGPQTGTDLWLLPPDGKPRAWLATGAEEWQSRFSPDGRVVAYSSNTSGRFEVYVQSRDNPADRAQVSAAGGTMPVWSENGDRLFFRQGNIMMEASVHTAGGLSASAPVQIFDGGWTRAQEFSYDVLPDGQRFLMVEQARDAIATKIDVVLNWFTTLKERMRQ